MTRKTIVSIAAGTALLIGVVAAAGADAAARKPAPKPAVCKLVTDPAGDAWIGGSLNPAQQPSYDSLDILSGDVATGARNLVAALRLKTTQRDALLVGGSTYELRWKIADVTYSLYYRVFQDGSTEGMLHASTFTLGADVPVEASVDPVTATISWKADRKLFPELKKAGSKLTGISGYSSSANNVRDRQGRPGAPRVWTR